MKLRTTIMAVLAALFVGAAQGWASDFYVSQDGSDANPGTRGKPFATLAQAQRASRNHKGAGVTVWLCGGTYYLPQTLVFTAEDSGTKESPVCWRAVPGQTPVISGGVKLELAWAASNGGIFTARTPAGFATDQLFVDGQLQHMARYPNYDANVRIFHGYAADAIAPERATRWADPAGGFIHAQHHARWGSYHYIITGKDADGKLTYDGGWQHNYKSAMHDEYRMVENIFEELDAPGEWFLNQKTNALYFYPPAGIDLAHARVEAARLTQLVEFRGSATAPVKFVTLAGLTFRHAARTFMETREPLEKSDWRIARRGAVFVEGAEDCGIEDCTIEDVGGNAAFLNMYNRRVTIRGCHITRIGASGVCVIGGTGALRPRSRLGDFDAMEKTPGPGSPDYPAACAIDDCLIHDIGQVEKQVAGVAIDIAQGTVARHCSIYDCPRAGISINGGSFGGHLIEDCDVFDTVMETHDHGAFNAWGRDRYWHKKDVVNKFVGKYPELPFLDSATATVIRHNRWRCDDGWDIDLDDGSTNYRIVDNLCLAGGIKRADGYRRVIENNITVNDTLHIHKWYYNNMQDAIRHNIVFKPYALSMIDATVAGERIVDENVLHTPGVPGPAPAAQLQKTLRLDQHSLAGDALFTDPAHGDWRVKEGSLALTAGFKNFAMDQFGVRKPELRKIARTAPLGAKKKGERK